jgi:hypothetical protein
MQALGEGAMIEYRIAGISLIIGLVAWIIASFVFSIGYHPTPEVLGLGSAFDGSLQLPADTIKVSFEEARKRMLNVNSWGIGLRRSGDLAAWLSFAASASITLILGYFGRAPAAQGSPGSTDGLPQLSVRAIGSLAALAAVLTGFANLSVAKSQDYYKRADEVRALIIQARAQVIDAKSADEAQAVIDNLNLNSKR